METSEGINKIRITHELVDKILQHQQTYIELKYSEYKTGDIVELIDSSNEKSVCKILVISKNELKNKPLEETCQYYFIIYSTEEEERLLNQRLKALGYI